MLVSASAAVTDVNRQQYSASTSLLVHPADRYVGLRARRTFVEKGQPFDLDVIGVDLDGKAAVGAAIDVRAVRVDWAYVKGRYVRQDLDPQRARSPRRTRRSRAGSRPPREAATRSPRRSTTRAGARTRP